MRSCTQRDPSNVNLAVSLKAFRQSGGGLGEDWPHWERERVREREVRPHQHLVHLFIMKRFPTRDCQDLPILGCIDILDI